MSDWPASLGGRSRATEAVGWIVAAAVVVAAHGAGGYWLMQAMQPTAPVGAEEVIFDIALEAAAPPEPQPEPEAQSEPPMAAAPEQPLDEDSPEDLPEPVESEPVPQIAEPEQLAEAMPDALPQIAPPPEPLPEPVPELPVNELAEAILAPEASQKPPPRPEKKKASKQPAAPRTVAPPKVDAPKVAEVARAPAVDRGMNAEKAETNWRNDVNRRVARHMARWDNSSRKEVSLRVTIAVDGSGRVSGVSVEGSTGDARLDASLQAHAAKLTGLPRTPDGNSRNLRVPVTLSR